MSGVALRELVPEDLPRVLELEDGVFGDEAWTEGMFRDELAAHTRRYLAAEVDGSLVGYAGICAYGAEAFVQNLAVDPQARGHGIGSTLLRALMEEAQRRRVRRLLLEVRADNVGAMRLYEAHGFRRIGIRRAYYQPSGMDAVVMQRRAPFEPAVPGLTPDGDVG